MTYGVPCAIIGRPNVGKSSLLNRLVGFERAIVTDIPGTTRDTVEERITLGGVRLVLTDTAGLRSTKDPVEAMGVERSRHAVARASLVLLVLDGSAPLTAEDEDAMQLALEAECAICIVNKKDQPQQLALDTLRKRFTHVCEISAQGGDGLEALSAAIAQCFPVGGEVGGGAYLTNERQQGGAQEAQRALKRAREGLLNGLPPDQIGRAHV